MKIIELIMISIIAVMILITLYYFRMQRKMIKKRRKRKPKYELIEVNEKDNLFHEYYEPKIVEVVSSEEYL